MKFTAKRFSTALLICLGAFALFVNSASAKENLAAKAGITVSSIPNPLWTPAKAVDGSFEKTDGWLGDWGEYAPWVEFAWDSTVWIDEVSIMQANFREAGQHRYTRPKEIRLEFDSNDYLEFTLQDNEGSLQRMTFDPVGCKSLKVVIVSVYSDAKIKSLTGFQEVEIYKTDKPIENMKPRGLDAVQSAVTGSGSIDEKERHILELLNELMLELEEYFSQN